MKIFVALMLKAQCYAVQVLSLDEPNIGGGSWEVSLGSLARPQHMSMHVTGMTISRDGRHCSVSWIHLLLVLDP